MRADGSHSVGEPSEVQAAVALDNLLAILGAAGCNTDDLLKVTIYIAGVQHWPAFDPASTRAIWASIALRARWCRFRNCTTAT
ncbi:endoribonuclease L-PSP [Pseudomonas syringae pv. pisi str. 1704B]|uniref:Endoribonuclease L-PSP n=1 Tax=Pseudomonas syringae pv. pisi str. 1704B TaxID=629263 RepID=F3G9A8_PSESJ|nr:endoribonuclease L-PSP [Pseudomonas syringae pv. pisi str. 1704B]